jgi:hypothetical protein
MYIKALSLVLTLVLLFIGACYLVEYFETCYVCNPALIRKNVTDEFEKPDIIFAIVNFVFAIFSAYLIKKRKFSASVIVSGVIAGLQMVAAGMVILLNS